MKQLLLLININKLIGLAEFRSRFENVIIEKVVINFQFKNYGHLKRKIANLKTKILTIKAC